MQSSGELVADEGACRVQKVTYEQRRTHEGAGLGGGGGDDVR